MKNVLFPSLYLWAVASLHMIADRYYIIIWEYMFTLILITKIINHYIVGILRIIFLNEIFFIYQENGKNV